MSELMVKEFWKWVNAERLLDLLEHNVIYRIFSVQQCAMAANIILKINKFSQDAIHNAIEYAVEDQQALTNTLETVQSALQKPPKKQKKEKMFGRTDEVILLRGPL